MDPKFLNPNPPIPEKDKFGSTDIKWEKIDEMVSIINDQFDDDWTGIELDGRIGTHRYHHISIYDREGTLTSQENIFYRLYRCKLKEVILAEHDSIYIFDSKVPIVRDGKNSHVKLTKCIGLKEIRDCEDCTIFIRDCDISKLLIHHNKRCKILIEKGTSRRIDPLLEKNEDCFFYFENVTTRNKKPFKKNKDCRWWCRNCKLTPT